MGGRGGSGWRAAAQALRRTLEPNSSAAALETPRCRAAHDKALFDPLEDAHVVRNRRAAHIEDAAEARIPDLNVAGGPHELHGRERVHRHARRADRMTLGLEPARGIDRQGSVLLGKPLGHGARALSLRDQAHRLVFHQLGDGEAIVGLDEGKVGERDAGARGGAGWLPWGWGASRSDWGRKSGPCGGAGRAPAWRGLSAVATSAKTTAAAPSETSEQSGRLSGPATRGFFSLSVRQNS